jgi:hypothetical protein
MNCKELVAQDKVPSLVRSALCFSSAGQESNRDSPIERKSTRHHVSPSQQVGLSKRRSSLARFLR